MILLKVHSKSVAVPPFIRDAPGTVDVYRVSLRRALQRMELKTGNVEVKERLGEIQDVHGIHTARPQIGPNLSAPPFVE
jgi:hypothetical protein